MNEVCSDNRFEVIARAKEHIIKSTNIEVSKDEMKCLDNFLFRCWQMGWLKQYESTSEISNKCEDAISRISVLDTLDNTDEFMDEERTVENYKALLKECYEVLPSVTPKQKMCFDGMTNGEVIGLLFPGADIYHNRDFTLRELVFTDEWWNAPYKAESEGRNESVEV